MDQTERSRRARLLGNERAIRAAQRNPVEVRQSTDGLLTFTGFSSTTSLRIGGTARDANSQLVRDQGYDMGWYIERVMEGSFTKTLLEKPDLNFLANHEGLPMARTTIPTGEPGSLTLREYRSEDPDQHPSGLYGLHYTALADASDTDAQRLAGKVRSGLMDQGSFAFRVIRQNWSPDDDQREITEISLHRGDVSVCNYGANPTTPQAVRSLLAGFEDMTIAERDTLAKDPAVMRAMRDLMAVPSVETVAEAVREMRAGAALSTTAIATLKHILSLCAASDTAMDTAQQVLADLLGVANPDVAQDAAMGHPQGGDTPPAPAAKGRSLDLVAAHQFLARRR